METFQVGSFGAAMSLSPIPRVMTVASLESTRYVWWYLTSCFRGPATFSEFLQGLFLGIPPVCFKVIRKRSSEKGLKGETHQISDVAAADLRG